MKIFHVSTKSGLKSISESKIIEARPQAFPSYDDDGQETDILENRAYVCLNKESGQVICQALTNRREADHVLGEFETQGDVALEPDPKFKGQGFFSGQDIEIK